MRGSVGKNENVSLPNRLRGCLHTALLFHIRFSNRDVSQPYLGWSFPVPWRCVCPKHLADYRKKMEANLKVQRAQRTLDVPGEPRKVTDAPQSYCALDCAQHVPDNVSEALFLVRAIGAWVGEVENRD